MTREKCQIKKQWMRIGRMAKRKKATRRPALRSQDELKTVRIVEYEITSEPIEDPRYTRLPGQVKDTIERLYHEAQRHPHRTIPELVALVNKYPRLPMLYNYLSVAYSRAGKREKAEEVIRENYQRNPDYLFARLNYAELCRAQGDYEQIAEIFEHKFDLKLLYPNRKRFHISEVANFMGMMGVYFLETGGREVAERYYEALKEIAPSYPMTKLLRRKLHPGFLGRLLRP
jgi:tetratricopeptide (TPR) repeat protein